ncbi:hypothetical protein [Fibrobacter sp.]|uniref:hypothetical protein n=1 Tax=Fibrobacter sp. TaxID=35828 RepID=UPI0038645D39
MTLDDISKLLEHSFKDETLRNEVWKDFYAILPPPIGIGFYDDVLEFLDGAWKISQKKIFAPANLEPQKYFKTLQSLCPITNKNFFITHFCGCALNIERGKAFSNFNEKFITKNGLNVIWANIRDESLSIGDEIIRMITVYK